ncbi:KdsC family phosphatase [Leadbetterella byssophila]|uniref:3-deoxy-D-manno-octulosonate 8-phosphate phosphatase KdsC n=1 Tax=Leadbetterella byssophila (strain DSM 17132 / JCM 16389 / KACC 11308 / NBRC 106382 / 4M15) TaxID=649349 RepID=E4RXY5_LEAB4|nr:HAD family hydrolase [Leadbetterella byssophila]ADQ19082.1 3-deoxy-D-manno-octulosonate 8-phosphate phosphatase, YrbI family [Leadbetterella byssophila DSM 17132]
MVKRIKGFVFDVDGVFTDATLTVTQDDVTRTFNVRDGYAVQMAVKSGYHLAVISGGKQESIVKRMNAIGIQDVYINVGTAEKPKVMQEYLDKVGLKPEEVLFIGDDIPDLLLMKAFPVLACCPADAVSEVKEKVAYITTAPGGKGAVREVIEWVMKAQDKWMKVL